MQSSYSANLKNCPQIGWPLTLVCVCVCVCVCFFLESQLCWPESRLLWPWLQGVSCGRAADRARGAGAGGLQATRTADPRGSADGHQAVDKPFHVPYDCTNLDTTFAPIDEEWITTSVAIAREF